MTCTVNFYKKLPHYDMGRMREYIPLGSFDQQPLIGDCHASNVGGVYANSVKSYHADKKGNLIDYDEFMIRSRTVMDIMLAFIFSDSSSNGTKKIVFSCNTPKTYAGLSRGCGMSTPYFVYRIGEVLPRVVKCRRFWMDVVETEDWHKNKNYAIAVVSQRGRSYPRLKLPIEAFKDVYYTRNWQGAGSGETSKRLIMSSLKASFVKKPRRVNEK